MKKHKFLLYPILFLVIVLIVDKVFLLDYFQERFLQTGNPVFYHHRKLLFERIQNDPDVLESKKKLILTLGDSRSYPFSDLAIPESERKEWTVYNFSGPQAVPMYSLYWLERILEKGIKPEIIILSLSPEGFDDSKGMIYDPFLRLGADANFKKKYWKDIPFKDKYEYYIDRLFAFRSIQFDAKLFWERFKSNKLDEYNPDFNQELMILKMSKGEYLAYAAIANVPSKLKKDTERIKSIYLDHFELGETEFGFVERIATLTQENGIHLFILWPRVYPDYRKNYYELGLDKTWWNRIANLDDGRITTTINFNEDTEASCDLYNDASHQSIFCFSGQMESILDRYHGGSGKIKKQILPIDRF